MNREGYWSVVDVLNHLYCPWITYNWYVLRIPQGKTTKTKEGLRRQNEYVRKVKAHPERGIGGIKGEKLVAQRPVRSRRLMLAGKCDYVVHKNDIPVPVEIKNGRMPARRPWKNNLVQITSYCLMLGEEIGVEIEYGFIHYLNDGLTQKVFITEQDIYFLENLINDMNMVLEKEIVLGKPKSWRCCIDCYYRKTCALSGGL